MHEEEYYSESDNESIEIGNDDYRYKSNCNEDEDVYYDDDYYGHDEDVYYDDGIKFDINTYERIYPSSLYTALLQALEFYFKTGVKIDIITHFKNYNKVFTHEPELEQRYKFLQYRESDFLNKFNLVKLHAFSQLELLCASVIFLFDKSRITHEIQTLSSYYVTVAKFLEYCAQEIPFTRYIFLEEQLIMQYLNYNHDELMTNVIDTHLALKQVRMGEYIRHFKWTTKLDDVEFIF